MNGAVHIEGISRALQPSDAPAVKCACERSNCQRKRNLCSFLFSRISFSVQGGDCWLKLNLLTTRTPRSLSKPLVPLPHPDHSSATSILRHCVCILFPNFHTQKRNPPPQDTSPGGVWSGRRWCRNGFKLSHSRLNQVPFSTVFTLRLKVEGCECLPQPFLLLCLWCHSPVCKSSFNKSWLFTSTLTVLFGKTVRGSSYFSPLLPVFY